MSKDLLTEYLIYLSKSNKSTSTVQAYSKDIADFIKFNGTTSIKNSGTNSIKAFLYDLEVEKNLTKKTLARKLNSIRNFYKFLFENNHVKDNPSLSISYPRGKLKKQRVLSKEECKIILDISKSNKRLYTIIQLLLQTGMRISELSRLKNSDLFLSAKTPYINIQEFSSLKGREVPLVEKAYYILKDYLNDFALKPSSAPVFYTIRQKEIKIRNIRSSIDRAFNKAKIEDACVNDFRNTFIVRQLESGNSIEYIANICGHKTQITTERYLKLLNKKYKPSKNSRLIEVV
jgi:site-specific recombinase XerD